MKNYSNTLRSIFTEHIGKTSDKWSMYLDEYNRLFDAHREQPVRLLEIGVQNGGSLEIWSKFFSNAKKIIGCDINPDCAQLQFDDPKIAVVVADANTDEAERHILELSPAFDLIIDDGSHHSADIVRSFARYFSHVSDGGLYVAEDLHCSYWQDFDGGIFHPYSSIAFFKRLADVINHEHWGVDKTRCELLSSFNCENNGVLDDLTLAHIHSIEFINSMCVIRKAQLDDNILGNRLIVGTNALVCNDILPFHGSGSLLTSQKDNEWSARDAPVEVEVLLQAQEIAGLSTMLSMRDLEIISLNQAIAEREREHLAQIDLIRQQFESGLLELATREIRFTQQLQEIRQAHELQIAELEQSNILNPHTRLDSLNIPTQL
jgi:hypothetical protein